MRPHLILLEKNYTCADMLRDFAIAASLANLALINVWAEILTPIDASSRFSMRLPAARPDFIALVLSELMLSTILWILIQAVRAVLRRAPRLDVLFGAGLFALLLVPANGLRTRFMSLRLETVLGEFHGTTERVLLVAAVIIAAYFFARYHQQIVHATAQPGLVLSPLYLAITARAVSA